MKFKNYLGLGLHLLCKCEKDICKKWLRIFSNMKSGKYNKTENTGVSTKKYIYYINKKL